MNEIIIHLIKVTFQNISKLFNFNFFIDTFLLIFVEFMGHKDSVQQIITLTLEHRRDHCICTKKIGFTLFQHGMDLINCISTNTLFIARSPFAY